MKNTGEARALRIKGYGNAIVPELAALFIRSFLEIHTEGNSSVVKTVSLPGAEGSASGSNLKDGGK